MKKCLLAVFVSIFVFPLYVFAYDFTCENKELNYGDTFNCSVNGANLVNYDKFSGTVKENEYVSCSRIGVSEGLNVIEGSSNSYFNLSGTPTSNELVKFSCKVTKKATEDSNTQLSIDDFTYHILDSGVDEVKEILSTDYINIKKYVEKVNNGDGKPRSTSDPNSRLKSLTDKNLDLVFSQFVTTYNIEVLYEVDELNLSYQTSNPDASVRIDGDQKLSIGKNVIDVYVTSPDESSTTCYTLNIKRLARGEEIYYKEKDASLSSLVIKGYTINFEPVIHDYSIHLTRDIYNVEVIAKATNENAVITINQPDELKNGSVIVVNVKSEDESTTSVYKINITKDGIKEDFSSILILGGLILVIVVIITLFILTSQKKKKDDPILKLKKSKRKMNKGEKFNNEIVPVVAENTNTVVNNEQQPNNVEVPSTNVNETNAEIVNEVPNNQVNQVPPAEPVINEQVSVPPVVNEVEPVEPVPTEQVSASSVVNEVEPVNTNEQVSVQENSQVPASQVAENTVNETVVQNVEPNTNASQAT